MMQNSPHLPWAAWLLATAVAGAPAQNKLQHGSVKTLVVPMPDGTSARVLGYTPTTYLNHGQYPLVVVIGDRGATAAATLRAFPPAVLDRKQMIVIAPEFAATDHDPANFVRMQQITRAAVDAALATWSTDPRRVVLLGIGRGASRAIALAGNDGSGFRAVLGLAPDDAWAPSHDSVARIPALVVTPGEGERRVAEALRRACGDKLPFEISERKQLSVARGELLSQSALEWFAARLAPPPREDEDRVHGRTFAATGRKTQVVAVKGENDEVESVLTILQIPHLVMTWKEFAEFDLADTDVLLVNCASEVVFGAERGRVNKKLRQFVTAGGHLFSTDWALRWPVSEVFSEYIGDLDPGTADHVVDVRPAAKAMDHELLQNVFPLDAPFPSWQIDAQSFLVRKDKNLEVVLESDELGALYGGNKMLGVCFRVGAQGGVVLDVVSHFSHQGQGAPTTPMYQLIVNFINLAKRHRQQKR